MMAVPGMSCGKCSMLMYGITATRAPFGRRNFGRSMIGT
jgi:hypothetical protein